MNPDKITAKYVILHGGISKLTGGRSSRLRGNLFSLSRSTLKGKLRSPVFAAADANTVLCSFIRGAHARASYRHFRIKRKRHRVTLMQLTDVQRRGSHSCHRARARRHALA